VVLSTVWNATGDGRAPERRKSLVQAPASLKDPEADQPNSEPSAARRRTNVSLVGVLARAGCAATPRAMAIAHTSDILMRVPIDLRPALNA
jgi:hypothetical protein